MFVIVDTAQQIILDLADTSVRSPLEVSFPCKECDQICRNAGSLKRHINSKHAKCTSRMSTSLPVTVFTKPSFHCNICDNFYDTSKSLEEHLLTQHGNVAEVSSLLTTQDKDMTMAVSCIEKSRMVEGFPCEVCGKVLGSKRTLSSHLQSVHAATSSVSLSG